MRRGPGAAVSFGIALPTMHFAWGLGFCSDSCSQSTTAHDPAAPANTLDSGLRRALTLSAGGTAAARITGAIGGVFAARLLGPSGRGQLAVLVFVAVAGSMAAAAGIQFWVARQVAREGGVASGDGTSCAPTS